jgi:hypothetical protein
MLTAGKSLYEIQFGGKKYALNFAEAPDVAGAMK